MSIEYSQDANQSLIVVVGREQVTLGERFAFVDQLINDPLLPARATILIDASQVASCPLPHEVSWIRQLLDKLRARFQDKIAIVDPDPSRVMVAQLIAYPAPGDQQVVKLFLTEADARDWLK